MSARMTPGLAAALIVALLLIPIPADAADAQKTGSSAGAKVGALLGTAMQAGRAKRTTGLSRKSSHAEGFKFSSALKKK